MSIFTLFLVVVSISRGFLDYFSFPVYETAVVTSIVGSEVCTVVSLLATCERKLFKSLVLVLERQVMSGIRLAKRGLKGAGFVYNVVIKL